MGVLNSVIQMVQQYDLDLEEIMGWDLESMTFFD